MHTLPTAMVQLLAPFTLLFSERVWRHAQVLLVGTILAPGKRTSLWTRAGCPREKLRWLRVGGIERYVERRRVALPVLPQIEQQFVPAAPVDAIFAVP
jgi:hypothetical protein